MERYSLVLDTGTVLEDLAICQQCVSFLRGVNRMEVVEAPVLMRGSDEDDAVEE